MKKLTIIIFFIFLSVVSIFSQYKDNFDWEKLRQENARIQGDNPPPPTDFTNSNYSLYQEYYAGVDWLTVNPSSDTGTGVNGMSSRFKVSMTCNGSFYSNFAVVITLPTLYSPRPGWAGIMIGYQNPNISNYNDIAIKSVLAVRHNTGGGDTMASSTIPQTVQSNNNFIWQSVEAALGNQGAGAWNQWIVSIHASQSFVGTKIFQFYMKGWVRMQNGDTIWTDVGSGTLNVPQQRPQLTYPTNGALNVPINPLCFTWIQISGLQYRIQVATDQYFTQIVYDNVVTGSSACVYGLMTGQTYYWRVTSRFVNGPWGGWSAVYWFTAGNVLAINSNGNEIPKEFSLKQNYPNPFNPVTNISFDIPKAGNVKLYVSDILGKEVAVLINKTMDAGKYNVDWNAEKFSSGIYFYRLEAEGFTMTKKMILMK
jgi:hypothetical protein